MKNKLSIEEIINKVSNRFNGKNLKEFELLLLDSGIKEDDIENFFLYPEGENFPQSVYLPNLRKRLRDENFLEKFATALFDVIDNGSKHELAYTLEGDNFILDKNNEFQKKDRVVFKLEYNPIDHVVTVNDMVISCPKSLSENDILIEFLFENPNKRIKIKNARLEIKGEEIVLEKTVSKIINQLGFKGLAHKIFFSGSSNKMIQLNNPITAFELRKRGYDDNLTLEKLFPEQFKKKIK